MYNHNKRIGIYGEYNINRMNDYTGFGLSGLESTFRLHKVNKI